MIILLKNNQNITKVTHINVKKMQLEVWVADEESPKNINIDEVECIS